MSHYPFQTIDWSKVPSAEQKGEHGFARAKTWELPGLRIRRIEYSPGYLADHWCKKGHIVHCLEGAFTSELVNGDRFVLSKDMTYVVSDNLSTHRSHTEHGVQLLIIDGAFLQFG